MELEIFKKYKVSLSFTIATCLIMLLWNFSSGNRIADFFIDYRLFVLLGVLIVGMFLLFYFFLLLINTRIKFYFFLINAILIIITGFVMFLFFIRKVNLHGWNSTDPNPTQASILAVYRRYLFQKHGRRILETIFI